MVSRGGRGTFLTSQAILRAKHYHRYQHQAPQYSRRCLSAMSLSSLEDVIDLTESPPASPQPPRTPTLSANTRASFNNPNRPGMIPSLDGPSDLPRFTDEIDLTQDDDGDEDLRHTQDDDEDEDLNRAIALSLMSHQEELDKAEKDLSAEEKQRASDKAATQADLRASKAAAVRVEAQKSNSGLFGLDRKAMEQERLARLKRKQDVDSGPETSRKRPSNERVAIEMKSETETTAIKKEAPTFIDARTRPISPPPITNSRSIEIKAQDDEPLKQTMSVSAAENRPEPSKSTLGATSTMSNNSHFTPRLYPHGTLLFTPSHGSTSTHPPSSTLPTITFPTILHPISSLRSALLSSFQLDFDFLLPHFNTTRTTFLFIPHTVSDAHRQQLLNSFDGIKNVKLVFPTNVGGSQGYGTMHSKLMLLFYEGDAKAEQRWNHGRCRIVIPTGNLVPFDWGIGAAVMLNAVWVCDLPILTPEAKPPASHFKDSLVSFLTAQFTPLSVLTRLNTVDFSALHDTGFVSSVAGFHFPTPSVLPSISPFASSSNSPKAPTTHSQGLLSLSSTLHHLNLTTPPNDDPHVEIITSSLGALTPDFLSTLYSAIKGDLTPTSNPKPTKPTHKDISTTKTPPEAWRDNLRIYFHSRTTVLDSSNGPQNAGTVCFNQQWWERTNFPREVVRDCVATSTDEDAGVKGALMHVKMIAVRFPRARKALDGDARGGGGHVLGTVGAEDAPAAEGDDEANEMSMSMSQLEKIKGKARVKESSSEASSYEKMDNKNTAETKKAKVLLGWCYIGSANCSESAW